MALREIEVIEKGVSNFVLMALVLTVSIFTAFFLMAFVLIGFVLTVFALTVFILMAFVLIGFVLTALS